MSVYYNSKSFNEEVYCLLVCGPQGKHYDVPRTKALHKEERGMRDWVQGVFTSTTRVTS